MQTADDQQAGETTEPSGSALGLFLSEIYWILLFVLVSIVFQIVVAKPFYIPSVSMMPTLLTGDRLLASKYPYGWSWVSMVPRVLPPMKGRIMGSLPERGDIVTVTPPGQTSDYIKRVIGLPGDTVQMDHGQLILNGKRVPRRAVGTTDIPVDVNTTCTEEDQIRYRVRTPTGLRCRLPVFRETLPGGASYDTLDLGYTPAVDDYGPIRVPAGRVFVMGDNRDQSADSRVDARHFGLDGPVPLENIGARAEFITFSLTGRSWLSFRSGRAGTSLRPDMSNP